MLKNIKYKVTYILYKLYFLGGKTMKSKKNRCAVVIVVIFIFLLGTIVYVTYNILLVKNINKSAKKNIELVSTNGYSTSSNIKISESTQVPILENNYIYITGTDINNKIVIGSFTQKAVDKYDIVYAEDTSLGSDDPFVLGHDYRSLGILYQTEVGALIYLNIDNVTEIYEVVISEYGIQNKSKDDIIGQTTGTSIWDSYEEKTLHLYTCYGNNRNGRWIVLAKKIN